MDALVMAGGKGSRMGCVEKPMVILDEKPMLDYIIEALVASPGIEHIYVIVSDKAPITASYIVQAYDKEKVSSVIAPGNGYVEDTAFAVRFLKMFRPFLIASSDIPLLAPDIINKVVQAYQSSGKEALSVRIEPSCLEGTGIKPDTILTDTGFETIPAGINVLHGAYMDRAQEEVVLLLKDARLALNVNYKKDIALFRSMRMYHPNR